MKNFTFAKTAVIGFVLMSNSLFAETVTGKVAMLEIPTNTDVNTVYFRLDPMPLNITQVFYIRNGTGTTAGCSVMGNEKSTDRAYSLLLSAKATQKSVTVTYCIDNNGYGLVNGSVRYN